MVPQEDLEDLQQGNLPLLSTLAQELARRDYRSLATYAPIQGANFQEQVTKLKRIYERLVNVSTRSDKKMQGSSYDSRSQRMIEGILNPELLRLTTHQRELRDGFMSGQDDEGSSSRD